jgi:hypothetical protein
VANTVVYYDTAKITGVNYFIVQAANAVEFGKATFVRFQHHPYPFVIVISDHNPFGFHIEVHVLAVIIYKLKIFIVFNPLLP